MVKGDLRAKNRPDNLRLYREQTHLNYDRFLKLKTPTNITNFMGNLTNKQKHTDKKMHSESIQALIVLELMGINA